VILLIKITVFGIYLPVIITLSKIFNKFKKELRARYMA
jgi:hypothetical protein